jgi:hypothetical protein
MNINIPQIAEVVAVERSPTIEIEPPPDGGYGWVCTAACFTLNGFTWGVVSVSLDSSSVFKS